MTHPIITAIEERSSTSFFDASYTVSDEQIGELVRLATKAPTSFNLQNWRFIAVRSPEAKKRLRSVAWDQAKVEDASVTFIICGQLTDERVLADRLAPVVEAGIMPAPMVAQWEAGAHSLYSDQPGRQRDEAVRTATLGAATLMFAAQAMGLGTAPMIGFDPEAVARDFGLAANEIPVILIGVGQALPENWAQKPRRRVSEILQYL